MKRNEKESRAPQRRRFHAVPRIRGPRPRPEDVWLRIGEALFSEANSSTTEVASLLEFRRLNARGISKTSAKLNFADR